MGRIVAKLAATLILVASSALVGALFSFHGSSDVGDTSLARSELDVPAAPPTFIRVQNQNVILSTLTPEPTPTRTLLPPPTLEPPTVTPIPTLIPSATPRPTTEISVSLPGLHGAETPTPTSTPGCKPREDWKLTYTVQFDDTLTAIADKYGVWVDELAEGNCIIDKNVIVVGQALHVPGDAHPSQPEVECVPWEVLTPFNGSVTVPADGSITFSWRGPAAPINLIRIYRPDGTVYERVIELRQNERINLTEYLSLEGTYTWYVFPLGRDFQQVECLEGGPWTFYKSLSSAPTPTVDPSAAEGNPGGM